MHHPNKPNRFLNRALMRGNIPPEEDVFCSYGDFGGGCNINVNNDHYRQSQQQEANDRDTLGVSGFASQGEIKAAYRRLALTEHPDKVMGDWMCKKQAHDRFAAIHAAYERLTGDDGATLETPQLPRVLFGTTPVPRSVPEMVGPVPASLPLRIPTIWPTASEKNIAGLLTNEPADSVRNHIDDTRMEIDDEEHVRLTQAAETEQVPTIDRKRTTIASDLNYWSPKRRRISSSVEHPSSSSSSGATGSTSFHASFRPSTPPVGSAESNNKRRFSPSSSPTSPSRCFHAPSDVLFLANKRPRSVY